MFTNADHFLPHQSMHPHSRTHALIRTPSHPFTTRRRATRRPCSSTLLEWSTTKLWTTWLRSWWTRCRGVYVRNALHFIHRMVIKLNFWVLRILPWKIEWKATILSMQTKTFSIVTHALTRTTNNLTRAIHFWLSDSNRLCKIRMNNLMSILYLMGKNWFVSAVLICVASVHMPSNIRRETCSPAWQTLFTTRMPAHAMLRCSYCICTYW